MILEPSLLSKRFVMLFGTSIKLKKLNMDIEDGLKAFFKIDWERGLTECQDDEYCWDQPVEVTPHEYEKTITVRDWIEVKK